eukprot:1613066-Rhodomonas_salina.3
MRDGQKPPVRGPRHTVGRRLIALEPRHGLQRPEVPDDGGRVERAGDGAHRVGVRGQRAARQRSAVPFQGAQQRAAVGVPEQHQAAGGAREKHPLAPHAGRDPA